MTWVQRILLIVAGGFLLMLAFGVATGSYDGDAWLALIEFMLAIGCLFLAGMPMRKSNDGR